MLEGNRMMAASASRDSRSQVPGALSVDGTTATGTPVPALGRFLKWA